MFTTRVLDIDGRVEWHGVLPNKLPHINVTTISTKEGFNRKIKAAFEREISEEDGGPILIYRIIKETIQNA